MPLYRVVVNKFAEKHYCKDLAKKHKTHWAVTFDAILAMLRNPEVTLHETDRLETITHESDIRIVKGYFKIHGEKVSAKKSGHRFIVRLDTARHSAEILLVYHKNHIGGSKETVWWQGILKKQGLL